MYKVYSRKLDHAFYLTDAQLIEIFNEYAKTNIDQGLQSREQYSYAGHVFMSISEEDYSQEQTGLGIAIRNALSLINENPPYDAAVTVQRLIKDHLKQGFKL